jgi:hypothetical protein
MKTNTHKLAVFSSLFLSLAFTVACNRAQAFGSAMPKTIDEGPSLEVDLSSGSFQEGFQYGLRNGTLISDRVERRTVGQKGCSGIQDLERGLIAIVRSARAPEHSNDQRVAGFYSGYIRAVKKALQDARHGCDFLVFTEGHTVGQLLGAVTCQTAGLSAEALALLDLGQLDSGWTGGVPEVSQECREVLLDTSASCKASLNETQLLACGDSS